MTDWLQILKDRIATVDTVVDAIKAVTDLLPDAGALNDLATILAGQISYAGTVTGVVAAPKFQCSALTGYGNDFFKGFWAYVVWDAAGGGALPQSQALECTGYDSAGGDFTVAAFAPNVIAVGDKVLLVHPGLAYLLLLTPTRLGYMDELAPANLPTTTDNILLDTQVRRALSGSKTLGTGVTKYLHIDSGTNGAQILAIIIKGVVGADWTLDVYVPAEDAAGATAAGDKRDTIPYVNTDTEGGLLSPFAIAYDCYLDFTNDSGGNDNIDQVIVMYRSRGVLTLTWET